MTPEQKRELYRRLGKTPPRERDDLALEVATSVEGNRLIWAADNLFVRVAGKSITWVFRYTRSGRTHSMNLGGYSDEREGQGKITLGGALRRAERLAGMLQNIPDIDLLKHRHLLQQRLLDTSLSERQKNKMRMKAEAWGLLPVADDGNDEMRRRHFKNAEAAFRAELRRSETAEHVYTPDADLVWNDLRDYTITTRSEIHDFEIFDTQSGTLEGHIDDDDDPRSRDN